MDILLQRHQWCSVGDVSVCGFCYDCSGSLVRGVRFASLFQKVKNRSQLVELLSDLNGQFAVAIDNIRFRAIAVDRIRTIPLYFNESAISDNPESLLSGHDTIDRQALLEYRATGNTFAGKTLVKGLNQVAAGAVVFFEPSGAQSVQYWQFTCRRGEERERTPDELYNCISKVFERVGNAVGDRPVVIPLSGGYDSRLVAAMLRRVGLRDAVCYHVGSANSGEERVARRVACALGYRYHLVRSDTLVEESAGFLHDDLFRQYYRYVGDYTNFVWLYDYFAIRHMRSKGMLDDGSVFMPGHSGDMVAGSHISKGKVSNRCSAFELAGSMVLRNFEYRTAASVFREVYDYFKAELSMGTTPVSAYQWFVLRNRQAQQIVNSTKVYAHMGYNCCLPLWDRDIVDFFRNAKYDALCNCSLYNQCAERVFEEEKLPTGKTAIQPPALARLALKRWLPKQVVNRMVDMSDETGELGLCQPMLEQLLENRIYITQHHFTSGNEIIKDWYEMQVRSELEHPRYNE